MICVPLCCFFLNTVRFMHPRQWYNVSTELPLLKASGKFRAQWSQWVTLSAAPLFIRCLVKKHIRCSVIGQGVQVMISLYLIRNNFCCAALFRFSSTSSLLLGGVECTEGSFLLPIFRKTDVKKKKIVLRKNITFGSGAIMYTQ